MQTETTPHIASQITGNVINGWINQSKAIIAGNDNILPLLGFSPKLFPELETLFISNPDGTFTDADIPTLTELKQKWVTLNEMLKNHFATVQPEEWLERHTAVSAEDFATQPNRNKLAILLSRTNHMSYHLGQLNLFPEKKKLKYNPFNLTTSLSFAF
jgi:hypothetical protein